MKCLQNRADYLNCHIRVDESETQPQVKYSCRISTVLDMSRYSVECFLNRLPAIQYNMNKINSHLWKCHNLNRAAPLTYPTVLSMTTHPRDKASPRSQPPNSLYGGRAGPSHPQKRAEKALSRGVSPQVVSSYWQGAALDGVSIRRTLLLGWSRVF